MKVLVTGGAGFIGSHIAEFYANAGNEVVIFDNISRAELLGYKPTNVLYNWNYLKATYKHIEFVKADVRDSESVRDNVKDVDVIFHAAAQTAVTTSMVNPRSDFEINAIGTFNVLEGARKSKNSPCVVFCSTNKVYGSNVNQIPVVDEGLRYGFNDEQYRLGVPETFPIDLCEHTPYGCSKLTGDIYVQDYAERNEVDAAVFRMSCIYGTRQFGVEDQGWVAWFTIATVMGIPITIYGDGKQVRDVLYITELVKAYDAFIKKRDIIHHGVYNIGGGPENTLSLLELINILEDKTGNHPKITFSNWRPSDQRVYISDIQKIRKELGWKVAISPKNGIGNLIDWVQQNRTLFR